MSPIAFAHGKNTVFSVDSADGTLRDLSQYCDTVSGLPGGRDLSEVTAFGDEGVKNIPGLKNVSFSVSGHWDPTATTGPDAVLSGLLDATATSSFEYGPGGSGTGAIKYSGEAWCSSYTTDSSVSDKVSFSAEFQVDGVPTRSTYT
ncbi:hypothetical protein [Nocardiopsis dassonvillei]|uniref:hypothetical protein n=1 Tax=Nocardiopsis dassonvillei TaxID=2014 RepID=UPI0036382C64